MTGSTSDFTETHTAGPGASTPNTAAAAFLFPLGDVVCMLQPLRYLARKHGGPVHVIVKKSWMKRLFAGIDYIAETYVLDPWRIPYWLSPAQIKAAGMLRRFEPAVAYVMPRQSKGKRKKCRSFLRHAGIPAGSIVDGIPEWQRPDSAQTDIRPGVEDLAPPEIRVFPEELETVRNRLQRECGWDGEPIVVIHPGYGSMAGSRDGLTAHSSKAWGWENWQQVAAGVRSKKPDAMVVFTGSDQEYTLVKQIADAAGGTANSMHNWAGKTAIGHLLALQSLADSGISSDSGPAHTALAVGCPLAVLYGNVDPRFMGSSPRGWGPCHTIRGADIGPHPLPKTTFPILDITPDTVLSAWESLPPRLAEPPPKSYVSHFLEGGEEPTVQLAGPGRFWKLGAGAH